MLRKKVSAMIKLELDRKTKEIFVKEPSEVTSLQNGFYGTMERGIISLKPEEAMYVMDIRNGKAYDEAGNTYTFNDIASFFLDKPKLLARYLTYKDWRDKGLILRYAEEAEGSYGRGSTVKYKSEKFKLDAYSFTGVFFPED